METILSAPVTLTSGAVKEVKKLINAEGFDTTQKLRIGVKGGGCSGLSYILGFDSKKENDQEYEVDGVTYLMDRCVRLRFEPNISRCAAFLQKLKAPHGC